MSPFGTWKWRSPRSRSRASPKPASARARRIGCQRGSRRASSRLDVETRKPIYEERVRMRSRYPSAVVLVLPAVALAAAFASNHVRAQRSMAAAARPGTFDAIIEENASEMMGRGAQIFRFDTFGDEAFWGGALKLHQAIAGARFGGVGPGVSPATALAVGLKVDADMVPAPVLAAIRTGAIDLNDPANTLALLDARAVIGVTAFKGAGGAVTGMGIQCALCHSTVDDSVAPGIGRRLDGWPNRDLDVGAVINLAPRLTPFTELLQVPEATVRQVLTTWGPGKFDADLALDGKGFRPCGE